MRKRQVMNEYLDGRLTPDRRAAFAAELADDPLLAAELKATEQVLAALRAIPAERAPVGLSTRIMAEVREQPAPLRRGWRVLLDALAQPRVLALAPVAAALLFTVYLTQPEPVRVQLEAPVRQVELAPNDEAFVRNVIADYQVAAVAQSGSAQSAEDATYHDVYGL